MSAALLGAGIVLVAVLLLAAWVCMAGTFGVETEGCLSKRPAAAQAGGGRRAGEGKNRS